LHSECEALRAASRLVLDRSKRKTSMLRMRRAALRSEALRKARG
jgi:hypothetical protein